MECIPHGYILSDVTTAMQNSLVDVFLIGAEYSPKDRFVLRNPDISFEAVIEICHPPNDEFIYDANQDTYLLLNSHDAMDMELGRIELKGACLKACQVTMSASGVSCVEAWYNCPVRVHVKRFQGTLAPPDNSLPVLFASRLNHFELSIQYGEQSIIL
jgi:hypothetical protein